MKIVLLSLLTLCFSCGKVTKESGNPGSSKNPICGKLPSLMSLCMPDIQWRITSSSVNFPKELAIIVEGNETYDSCKYQRDIIFTTDGSKTTFSLRQYIYPKKNFKLEIIDRGEDCKNNAIFFSGDSVEYKTSESNDGSSYYYTVDVKLNN